MTRLVTPAWLALVAACASSSSAVSDAGPICATYQVPAGTDSAKPTSFKNDVLPIFVLSCAFASCHGQPGTGNNGIALGVKPPGTNDASMVRAGIVNVKAAELPTMNFITPSDPSQSYLMHKMDGDNCTFDKACAGATCQSTMPQTSDLLPVETRDIVRRWIAQGAPDN